MINEKEIQKICNRQIDAHHTYLEYATNSFVGELTTIKLSIKSRIIEEISKRHPEVDTKNIEKTVSNLVESKLKTTVKIEFEG